MKITQSHHCLTSVRTKPVSLDDSDLEACLCSWNPVLENLRYLHEKMMPVSLLTPKTGLKQKLEKAEHFVMNRHCF